MSNTSVQVSSVQCDVSNAYVEWIVSVSNTLPISSHCPQDQLLTQTQIAANL